MSSKKIVNKNVPYYCDIFELGSYALLGMDEVIFKYQDEGAFPHDEFHCVLGYEADLYAFYPKDDKVDSLNIIDIKIENDIFYLTDIDGLVIYETPSHDGLDFDALKTSIEAYLNKFTIKSSDSIIILGNGVRISAERFKKAIRKEQQTFFKTTDSFNDDDKKQLIKSFLNKLTKVNNRKELKKIYRLLMKEYHPDMLQTNGFSIEKSLFCSKAINNIYVSQSAKY